MTITPEQLAHAKRLSRKATAGPWQFQVGMDARVHRGDGSWFSCGDAIYPPRSAADAALIAHHRTFCDELIAAYKAQAEELDAMRYREGTTFDELKQRRQEVVNLTASLVESSHRESYNYGTLMERVAEVKTVRTHNERSETAARALVEKLDSARLGIAECNGATFAAVEANFADELAELEALVEA